MRNFALKNQTPSAKKIYYFYGSRQFGEGRIAQYFHDKGYEIVSPEKLTLDEQLNLLINAESFASTIGSCSHNSIFLRDGTEVILIPRGLEVNKAAMKYYAPIWKDFADQLQQRGDLAKAFGINLT